MTAPKRYPPSTSKFTVGVNDLYSMSENFPHLLLEWDYSQNLILPTKIYFKSNEKVHWVCSEGHSYESSLKSRVGGSNCLKCWRTSSIGAGFSNSVKRKFLKDTHPHLFTQLVHKDEFSELSSSSHQKVEWLCMGEDYSHSYFLSVNNRVSGGGCYYCSFRKLLSSFNSIASVRKDLVEELSYPEEGELILANSKVKIWWSHSKEGITHYWEQRVWDRVYGGAGCTVCSGKTVQPGVNDFQSVFLNSSDFKWSDSLNSFSPDEISYGSSKTVSLYCLKHSSPVLVAAQAKSFSSGEKHCSECSPSIDKFRSKGEREVAGFIEGVFPTLLIESSVKRFRKEGVSEIDIFLPEVSLAIDFDGDYWHEEGVFKPVGYHRRKRESIERLGLLYFVVKEWEWKDSRSVVEAKLVRKISSFK